MHHSQRPTSDDVDHLLLNARLRDELEPYLDESVDLLNIRRLATPIENEFLASMLAWERAPILPIAQWFDPPLALPSPDSLSEAQLSDTLQNTLTQLYEQRIVLEMTEHLSDRELYCLICRDILPSPEKKIDLPKNYLHWHCLDNTQDPETWLTYYATDAERRSWQVETGETPPAQRPLPHRRRMPGQPNA